MELHPDKPGGDTEAFKHLRNNYEKVSNKNYKCNKPAPTLMPPIPPREAAAEKI